MRGFRARSPSKERESRRTPAYFPMFLRRRSKRFGEFFLSRYKRDFQAGVCEYRVSAE